MLKSVFNRKQSSLLSMLICLTLLFVAGQFAFFLIHYKVSDLIDSLVNASIALQLLHPVILLPMIWYSFLQIMAYALYVGWIWFISISTGELCRLPKKLTYWLGMLTWFLAAYTLLALNQYYFPDSFFAYLMRRVQFFHNHGKLLLIIAESVLCMMTLLAYVNFFWFKRYRHIGSVLLLLGFCMVSMSVYESQFNSPVPSKSIKSIASAKTNAKPNIIIIGLDSLRPDFTGFYGNKTVNTPNIDKFLDSATTFTQAYTPLARTFPAWVSVLTAKYPKHSDARNNLVDPVTVMKSDTLAKILQKSGYETIYATDEKRFSNITHEYGFDRVIGPDMGVNDFVLGGLSDFPLSNLMVNLPLGRYLFPFNYGNRAAAITYDPDTFLRLVKTGIANLPDKPVFLAVHLCLSHWPFTWAQKGQPGVSFMPNQYRRSVNGVDRQFGELLQMLKHAGLLENSMVVVLSDHGTALGMPGDRIISKEKYRGDKKDMSMVSVYRLSSASPVSADYKHDYTINTAYGQGTNVLSLVQNHVVLAFKRYDNRRPQRQVNELASLLDITPTILEALDLPPLPQADGISMWRQLSGGDPEPASPRAFFMETGDSLTEIETDHIYIEKVVKHEIGIYSINPETGLLTMNPPAEKSIIKNKQLAVMWNDWLLARYPAAVKKSMGKDAKDKARLVPQARIAPAYYVLTNLKTGEWTVGLASPFAKTAPTDELLQKLKGFYGDELPD